VGGHLELDKLIRRFQHADRATRLDALLDAARKLPPLPEHLARATDREDHRVMECQTPVYLWIDGDRGRLRIHADVPRESPTVRGFVALLASALDGQPPAAAAKLPTDLLHLMGLDQALGMIRLQGLSAIVARVRQRAGELARSS